MAHLERALDQAGLRLDLVRLVVCTHAHVDHCGQAPRIRERTGAEVWMHPDRAHLRAAADDPELALARRDRGRAPERRAGGAAAALGRAAARVRARGISGELVSDRDLLPGVEVATDLGDLAGDRDARPRALARLPAPARASPADLRRPPARARLAVLRPRLHAGPGRRVPGLAGQGRGARRAALPGRPRRARSPTSPAHVAANRELVAERLDAMRGDARRRAGHAVRARAADRTARRSPSDSATWLLAKTLSLAHAPRTDRVRRAATDPLGQVSRPAGPPRLRADADRRAHRQRRPALILVRVLPAQDRGRRAQPRRPRSTSCRAWTRRSSR